MRIVTYTQLVLVVTAACISHAEYITHECPIGSVQNSESNGCVCKAPTPI
jgi:hypothetical protein